MSIMSCSRVVPPRVVVNNIKVINNKSLEKFVLLQLPAVLELCWSPI